jgi:hypothetical protein
MINRQCAHLASYMLDIFRVALQSRAIRTFLTVAPTGFAMPPQVPDFLMFFNPFEAFIPTQKHHKRAIWPTYGVFDILLLLYVI